VSKQKYEQEYTIGLYCDRVCK